MTLEPIVEPGWIARFFNERWGGDTMVIDGEAVRAETLAGLRAVGDGGSLLGAVTWRIGQDGVGEVTSLDALVEGEGVGSALLAAAEIALRAAGCVRARLTTTNDNLRALGFYQRRGWRLVALRPDAMDAVRAVKPEVPRVGLDGIPLRDELELEKAL